MTIADKWRTYRSAKNNCYWSERDYQFARRKMIESEYGSLDHKFTAFIQGQKDDLCARDREKLEKARADLWSAIFFRRTGI